MSDEDLENKQHNDSATATSDDDSAARREEVSRPHIDEFSDPAAAISDDDYVARQEEASDDLRNALADGYIDDGDEPKSKKQRFSRDSSSEKEDGEEAPTFSKSNQKSDSQHSDDEDTISSSKKKFEDQDSDDEPVKLMKPDNSPSKMKVTNDTDDSDNDSSAPMPMKSRSISPKRPKSIRRPDDSDLSDDDFVRYVESDDEVEDLTEESVTDMLKEMSHESLLEVCIKLATDNLDSPHLTGISESSKKDPEKCKVFVNQFSYNITEKDLKMGFNAFGKVSEVSLIRHPDGAPRGFAFITFSKCKYAEKAINAEKIKCGMFEVHCKRPIVRTSNRGGGGSSYRDGGSSYGGGSSNRGGGGYNDSYNGHGSSFEFNDNSYGGGGRYGSNSTYGSGYGSYSSRRY